MKLAQRRDRRHFDDPSSRPDRVKGRRKLSIMELKKITRCANCGDRGHWAEDCRKAFRPRASTSGDKNGGGSGNNAFVFLGSSSSSGYSGHTFFCDLMAASENFLSLPGGHAIVDPGASQDLIGLASYHRLQRRLSEVGLRTIELDEKPSPASGVGGSATPVLTALSPCMLGQQPGVIRLSVVKEDVPQLVSIGLLELGGAIIDTNCDKIFFKKFGGEVDMRKIDSGHRTIDVSTWPGGAFPVPKQLTSEFGIQPGDFNLAESSSALESYVQLCSGQCDEETSSRLVYDKGLDQYIREFVLSP